jgi:hypothetical protein
VSAATSPTPRRTPRFDRIVAARWEHWSGPVGVWLALRGWRGIPAPTLDGLRRDHAEWLAELLSRGIPLRQIRRAALDDPREPRLVVRAKMELYLTKRRLANANVKGTG